MNIKEIFVSGEKSLTKFRNLIGIGVIFMLILMTAVFLMTSATQKKISEKCGFDDGKIKCVCTGVAWNSYQNDLEFEAKNGQNSLIMTKGLNSSYP